MRTRMVLIATLLAACSSGPAPEPGELFCNASDVADCTEDGIPACGGPIGYRVTVRVRRVGGAGGGSVAVESRESDIAELPACVDGAPSSCPDGELPICVPRLRATVEPDDDALAEACAPGLIASMSPPDVDIAVTCHFAAFADTSTLIARRCESDVPSLCPPSVD